MMILMLKIWATVWDSQKLKHLQGQYFRELSPERITAEIHRAVDERVERMLPLFRERMVFGGDFIWQAEPFYAETVHPHPDDLIPKGLDKAQTKWLLEELQKSCKSFMASDSATWTAAALDLHFKALLEERSKVVETASAEQQAQAKLWTSKVVFMLLRVASTGKRESPPLFDTLELVGAARTIERLGLAQQKLR